MAPETPRTRILLRIERIVYPGRSLARREGKVIFTDEGLPGELVEAEIIRDRKDYGEARTTAVLEPAAERRAPRCKHYRACSPYQVLDYDLELRVKRDQVAELIGRRPGLEPEKLVIQPSPETWGYRNRARFHLLGQPGSLTLAYNRPGSTREFIPVEWCFLVSERMNGLLAATLEGLNAAETEGVADIEVRESGSRSGVLVVLSGGRYRREAIPRSLVPDLTERFPLKGLVWLEEWGGAVRERVIFGAGELEEEAAGVRYRFGARSFFQVNRYLLGEALLEARRAADEVGARKIADLYCGVGTFGLALAAQADEVEGVESEPANTARLKRNIPLNGLTNFRVRAGTAERWIREVLGHGPDLVMVDPPRKGLGPSITGPLRDDPPGRLVYLSCDLATLARDLADLRGRFTLTRLTLLDFFPHTPHIETLSVLDRR